MTEEQRDNLLIVISNMIKEQATALEKILAILNEHTEMLKEHTATLNEHTIMLKEHTAALNEHTEMLKEHTATLNEHTIMLKEHTQELIKQRQNMVKLEHELTDKIMALFDLGEVNNDKFEEEDLRIKGMQNTLDWHNRRILKLETAN